MNNYIAFYMGKKIPVQAESSYQAQLRAQELLKVKPKDRHLITVVYVDKPVDPASIG